LTVFLEQFKVKNYKINFFIKSKVVGLKIKVLFVKGINQTFHNTN